MEKKVVKLEERVFVVGTGTAKTFPKGEKFKVHPNLAEKLIKSGKAVKA